MDKKAQQRNKDAQQRRELMRAMERQATLYTLRHIRDDTGATPAEKLKAIELLMKLEKN